MPLVQISVPHTSTKNLRHKSILRIWSWNESEYVCGGGLQVRGAAAFGAEIEASSGTCREASSYQRAACHHHKLHALRAVIWRGCGDTLRPQGSVA